MVHASPSSRCYLARGEAPHHSLTVPLTATDLNKTEASVPEIGLSSFYSFE
jgi:hypothetical protein